MPHVWVAYLESVNCKELSHVFLVLSLDRHISFTSFLYILLFVSNYCCSFPTPHSQKTVVCLQHCTHLYSPWFARPQIFPTHSIIFLFDFHCLESYSTNLSSPLLSCKIWASAGAVLAAVFFPHIIIIRKRQKGNLNSLFHFVTCFFFSLAWVGLAPQFCGLVCFVRCVCSWLSFILQNIHVAFQRTVFHFVDVIIMALSPIITTAVTVTTRKCFPTHFSDKKLPRVLLYPMVH